MRSLSSRKILPITVKEWNRAALTLNPVRRQQPFYRREHQFCCAKTRPDPFLRRVYYLCMGKKPEIKKHKTFSLKLNRYELLHLRDLFSIVLPPEGKQTVSSALAALENRTLVEALLWQKLSRSCEKAKLPVGEAAPDYVVAPVASPQLGIFQIAHEQETAAQAQSEPGLLFEVDEGP